ncbi:MAG TPA: hypothetical protein VGP46_06610 [Acidimicrobiales bacterium]|jgi:hypothetical protein|nr:hypothetical protein [Acidimicrobiales bacterium]
MEDLHQSTADAQRALNDHLAAMAEAAAAIEHLLTVWAHQTAWGIIEKAVNDDPHRTQTLHSSGTLFQLREEEETLIAEFPQRIHASLTRNVWRHLYVDTSKTGTGNIMSDLDYGIWQHTGYKIPPAYESIITNLLSKVTQLLRKYGYRPEFGRMGNEHRHSAPPDAIAPMEQYYRLSMRLGDMVTAVEHSKVRADQARASAAWDRR